MGVEKRCVAGGGKNIIFRRGGGINIVFGPKYRPLTKHALDQSLPRRRQTGAYPGGMHRMHVHPPTLPVHPPPSPA